MPEDPNLISKSLPESSDARKSSVWFMALPLAVLVLAGAVFVVSQERKQAPSQAKSTIQPSATAASTLTDEAKQQEVADIIKTGKLEDCSKAKGWILNGVDYETVCRNNVAMKLAMENLDYSYCSRLDDKMASISECEDLVLSRNLQKEAKVAVCDSAPRQLVAKCNKLLESLAPPKEKLRSCEGLVSEKVADCKDEVWLQELARNYQKVQCGDFSPDAERSCLQLKEIVAKRFASGCVALKDFRFQSLCEQLKRIVP